jgi:hypothetical protein
MGVPHRGIVVSRREDRPKNATEENGIVWLAWGPRGEGIDSPQNRTDFGMLIMRIMFNNPSWAQSPDHVMRPGTEETVMGPYYPKGYYLHHQGAVRSRGCEEVRSNCSVFGCTRLHADVLNKRKHQKGAVMNTHSLSVRVGVAVLTLAVGLIGGISPLQAQDKNLKKVPFTETRGKRYGEVFLVKPDGIFMYNTTGLNDCPADLWNKPDVEKIKEQYGAREVFKNGPHFWVSDTLTLDFGETLDFGGIKARFVGKLPVALVEGKSGGAGVAEPYKVFHPEKSAKFSYLKGRDVYELVDASGTTQRPAVGPMESKAAGQECNAAGAAGRCHDPFRQVELLASHLPPQS